MTDFPYRSITIEKQQAPMLYQADCERCGWHTRQSESEGWVTAMAEMHFAICPNPHFRSGALMECGCWFLAMPGDSAGTTKATCPLHGETLMLKANVDEPTAWGRERWIPAGRDDSGGEDG